MRKVEVRACFDNVARSHRVLDIYLHHTDLSATPWGLQRMTPFPASVTTRFVLPYKNGTYYIYP